METIKPGDQAPMFTSTDDQGNSFDSKSCLGKRWVLYFYPKDLTSGCTIQACNIRDHYLELQEQGIQVIGVSADDVKTHQKFKLKHKLPFTLIADSSHEVLLKYGVWGEKKFMGRVYDGIHRTTFVMDESATVLEVIKRPKNKIHAEEILKIYTDSAERK